MSCSMNFRDVSFFIDEKKVFEKVSFNLGHEEKIAIVGANGTGKSSILKIAAGLYQPTDGYIELFHNKISNKKEFNRFRDDIGYLPQEIQNHFLCPTVIEDVCFGLRAKGISKNEAVKKANEVLESLNISHLSNRVIFDLSGGEQKIVALAGLLILKPKILLLDEPTNALDEDAQSRLIDILKNIKKSMIIVSHHKSFIEELAPSIYRLENFILKKEENIKLKDFDS